MFNFVCMCATLNITLLYHISPRINFIWISHKSLNLSCPEIIFFRLTLTCLHFCYKNRTDKGNLFLTFEGIFQ